MLFNSTILTWNTKHPGKRLGVSYLDYYLLNTNRIIELRELGEHDSKFYYANDPDDARDSPDYIESSDPPSTIRIAHDYPAASKFITLPIFPGFDITETAVETMLETDNIAYVWQTPRDLVDEVCHMVYYRKAWERVECMVELSLTQLLYLSIHGELPPT